MVYRQREQQQKEELTDKECNFRQNEKMIDRIIDRKIERVEQQSENDVRNINASKAYNANLKYSWMKETDRD